MHRIDIEAAPVPAGSLDVLVYDDVLEHLRDPWGVLKRDSGLLAPGGTLLVCVLRWFSRAGMQPGGDPNDWFRRSQPLQYVWRAVKPAA